VDQNNIDHFFFLPNKEGVIYKELLPAANTANTEFCVLEKLLKWCWEWCCCFERKAVCSFCTLMPLVILPWWWSGSWWIVACWTASQLICLT
jgi:hypothetical protein